MAGAMDVRPHNVVDWATSPTIRKMSVTAQGVYFLLLDLQWEEKRLPPDEKLQTMIGASDAEWAEFAPYLDHCFPKSRAGHRQNARCATDREKVAMRVAKCRQSAQRGGLMKAQKKPASPPVRKPAQKPVIDEPLLIESTPAPWWDGRTDDVAVLAARIGSIRTKSNKLAYPPSAIAEKSAEMIVERLRSLDPGGDDVELLLQTFEEYHQRKPVSPYTQPIRALSNWISKAEPDWTRLKRSRSHQGCTKTPPSSQLAGAMDLLGGA